MRLHAILAGQWSMTVKGAQYLNLTQVKWTHLTSLQSHHSIHLHVQATSSHPVPNPLRDTSSYWMNRQYSSSPSFRRLSLRPLSFTCSLSLSLSWLALVTASLYTPRPICILLLLRLLSSAVCSSACGKGLSLHWGTLIFPSRGRIIHVNTLLFRHRDTLHRMIVNTGAKQSFPV